jgi:hypothetical protein
MLSNASRLLTYLCALLYGILGALLYLLPETLAPVFAWKVTAFMTMTLGGWCLGNAWLAYISARRWEWKLVYTALIYLWLFGIGELIVLFLFRDKLVLQHPIAWLYLTTLIVNTCCRHDRHRGLSPHRPSNARERTDAHQRTNNSLQSLSWSSSAFSAFTDDRPDRRRWHATAGSSRRSCRFSPCAVSAFFIFHLRWQSSHTFGERSLNAILHHSLCLVRT